MALLISLVEIIFGISSCTEVKIRFHLEPDMHWRVKGKMLKSKWIAIHHLTIA
jgi:hypothetical protein